MFTIPSSSAETRALIHLLTQLMGMECSSISKAAMGWIKMGFVGDNCPGAAAGSQLKHPTESEIAVNPF